MGIDTTETSNNTHITKDKISFGLLKRPVSKIDLYLLFILNEWKSWDKLNTQKHKVLPSGREQFGKNLHPKI